MFSIQFNHRGKAHALAAGEHYSSPRLEGFRDAPASELRALIAQIDAGMPWREVVRQRFQEKNSWLYRIIADASRTAFFEQLLPAGSGPVLDVGSGWGQVARPLARYRPVVALEPVAERLGFIQASARQDGISQLAYVEADFLEIEFATRFSAIFVIGVLEWVGAFQHDFDPQERQRRFLRKIRQELTEDGSLILGIENRIGLKYLLGCPDDHLGVPNVACLSAELARARWQALSGQPLQSFTYSAVELNTLLRDAGFANIEFFGAFPDYKLPSQIISLADGGRLLNASVSEKTLPLEHNGYDGAALSPNFQSTLQDHYRTLAAEGIAHHFVPSFFVRAR